MAECGIIIFNRGELPCPDCLKEARGCQLNPYFEACYHETRDLDEICGSRAECDACNRGELIPCDTCGGTGRVP
jgi:hypothetical protein